MLNPLKPLFSTIFLFFTLLPLTARAQPSPENPILPIIGKLSINAFNISGIVKTDQFLALATDEGTQIQILANTNQGYVATHSGVIDLNQTQRAIKEFDLEAMAWHKPYLYVIGSHSKKRKKLKPDLSVKKNMERITPVIDEPDRRALFRIKLSETLKPLLIDKTSLLTEIQNDPILSPFLAIPSKENGIDIEGLAVREHNGKTQLFVGFRGPVLRGNLTPILKLTLSAKQFKVKKSKLLLVNLGGFGIRDMQSLGDSFLLLAGPVNTTPNHFSLYDWQGKTQLSLMHEKLVFPTQQNEGNPEAIAAQNLPGWGSGIWMAKDGVENGDIRFYPFFPKKHP